MIEKKLGKIKSNQKQKEMEKELERKKEIEIKKKTSKIIKQIF